MMNTTYGFGTHLDLSYDEAIPHADNRVKSG
jgi:hypothetical protein